MDFQQKMDETRGAVSQITCWCALIALHQEFGVGAERLNRIQDELVNVQEEYSNRLVKDGSRGADIWLRDQVAGRGPVEFRIPMMRAPRGRKEQQLRMVGNESASIAWQMYALSCIRVLGYGEIRITRLHEEARKNYDQVNGWTKEGGLEYAFAQICKCAKLALREDLQVIDADPNGWDEYKEEFRMKRKMASRVAISKAMVKPVLYSDQEKSAIFERCRAETLGNARQTITLEMGK